MAILKVERKLYRMSGQVDFSLIPRARRKDEQLSVAAEERAQVPTISSAKTNKTVGSTFHLFPFLCKIFRKTKMLLLQKMFAIRPGTMSNALNHSALEAEADVSAWCI